MALLLRAWCLARWLIQLLRYWVAVKEYETSHPQYGRTVDNRVPGSLAWANHIARSSKNSPRSDLHSGLGIVIICLVDGNLIRAAIYLHRFGAVRWTPKW